MTSLLFFQIMIVLGILHTQVVSTAVSNTDGISLRSRHQRLVMAIGHLPSKSVRNYEDEES